MKHIKIPPAFWRDVTAQDLLEVMENGGKLTPELQARLYRMLDIQNPPVGEKIEVVVDRRDLERLLR